MARKNLLKGLMDSPAQSDIPAAPMPRTTKGAIGAVSQSIEALKSRAVTDLDPHLIEAGGVIDRLEHDEGDHGALIASIRDFGQQVPVLVRPHPETDGRYQIVYGRRRVLALRDLGQPVKAMIRDLDDRELVLAQGQENTARRDLSFIEKANFARQMRDAGYDRKIICAALHIDKTVVSRMLSVADRIPVAVIETIGSAPSVGRDRWLKLGDLITEYDTTEAEAVTLSYGPTSDQRFEALVTAITLPERRRREARARPEQLRAADGRSLGEIKRGTKRTTLSLSASTCDGFEDWLIENMTELHRQWRDTHGG